MKLLKTTRFTHYYTLHELPETDLNEDIHKVEVPVYFLMGKYDFITPSTKLFYEQLEAPDKELIIFENSGHVPSLDEPKKFENELLRVFKTNVLTKK